MDIRLMQGQTSVMSKCGCASAKNKKSVGAESMPKRVGITESTDKTWIPCSTHGDNAAVRIAADKTVGTATQAVTVCMVDIGETEIERPKSHKLLGSDIYRKTAVVVWESMKETADTGCLSTRQEAGVPWTNGARGEVRTPVPQHY